ncbi:putative F-box/LRR-repeat protein At1g56400 [Lotus japonicus]|uniref:putative F-box/LRR-repeat protein At1g56400 n=1 Tax=Lotus japonicus TaxID=34305 RepID=UPI002585A725|nr:putative F-box/LRR-repeat protein At1g56400 [Lotus japonicus]
MAPSTDKLSSLPHSLLSTIVSLIPFKEVVRTSILSKSWIDSFKSTSNIVFDEVYFVKDSQTRRIRQAQRNVFLEFVMLWISSHTEIVIDKFSLRISMPGKANQVVKNCIIFATKHGAKELELDFCDPKLDCYLTTNYINYVALFELPTHVYSHTCLESLKLFSCSFVEAELFNFNVLKDISLGWMEVKLTTIKTLLSNCKALENLSLKRCWNSDDLDLGEENLRLRKLVVERCMFRSDSFSFIVNAPKLRNFYYSGLNNNRLVIDVRSLIMKEEVLEFCIEFEGHAVFLYKLVEDISGVNILTVGNYFLQDYDLPMNFNFERFWTDHAMAYICMTYTLREMEIMRFKGSMNEICVLTYFITFGRVLRKMTINISKGDDADQDGRFDSYRSDMTELLMIQRASRDLEILIC